MADNDIFLEFEGMRINKKSIDGLLELDKMDVPTLGFVANYLNS